MRKHAQPELSPEWRQHFDELHELPSLKLRKERDREVWSWIYHLLIRQEQGAPYDLETCKLGRSPWNHSNVEDLSETLRVLMAAVEQEFPLRDGEGKIDRARRLYEAIRHWRKRSR